MDQEKMTEENIKLSMVESSVESYDEEKRQISFIFSFPTRDRSGDTVNISGIDLTSFLKNPVYLWMHDKSRPPVGKVVDIYIENNILKGTVEFWKNPIDNSEWSEHDKLSVTIYEQYKKGFMKGASIAFMPIVQDYDKINGGMIYTKVSLTEISAVPVPNNPDALSISKSIGKEDLTIISKAWTDSLNLATQPEHLNSMESLRTENLADEIIKTIISDISIIKDDEDWCIGNEDYNIVDELLKIINKQEV